MKGLITFAVVLTLSMCLSFSVLVYKLATLSMELDTCQALAKERTAPNEGK